MTYSSIIKLMPILFKKSYHYKKLHKKWAKRHKSIQKQVIEKHHEAFTWLAQNAQRGTATSALAGLLLLTGPQLVTTQQPQQHYIKLTDSMFQQVQTQNSLERLQQFIPDTVRPLTPVEETSIDTLLSQTYHMKVSAELDGIRLNRSYGLIGYEQHLYRYPGDVLENHAESAADYQYQQAGIAPGLGAWGYFAPSATSFTKLDEQRERWYIAVQTFLAPGYDQNVNRDYNFFKYRKMLVVNPQTGQAVVCDIGDSGPAPWTGKHLGGSPEVMHYLSLDQGMRKGAVLYFFIDDPNDIIPLGPVSTQ